jgi:F0F1-type ATP synthase assembly protein I
MSNRSRRSRPVWQAALAAAVITACLVIALFTAAGEHFGATIEIGLISGLVVGAGSGLHKLSRSFGRKHLRKRHRQSRSFHGHD